MFRSMITMAVYVTLSLLILCSTVIMCKSGYVLFYEAFGSGEEETVQETEVDFCIENGESPKEIAKQLQKKGLVENWRSFLIRYHFLESSQKRFEAGEYQLDTDMDYEEIMNRLTADGEEK